MLNKDLPDFKYDDPTTHPIDADFIDFTKVAGTDVYHFVSLNDSDCTPKQAQFLEDNIPTFTGKKEYGCYSDHVWFNLRGSGQLNWYNDMVDTLNKPVVNVVEREEVISGASTLAASALAAIATYSLVM